MPTNVYVDGFNLYNGMFKRGRAPSKDKWLDLRAVALTVWPTLAPIHRVRYFTARVKATIADPSMPSRQQVYIGALKASAVDIHFGQFKVRRKTWRLRGAVSQQPPSVDALILGGVAEVGKYDEKGSDVNLASYLVRDAAKADCTAAIVISNDSDLAEAIKIARSDFGIDVYVINPHLRAVGELRTVATDLRDLMPSAVGKSQLPASVVDATGKRYTKPPSWA